ncbi:hypothetical protein MMC29_008268 [Sticta canariensis]|nr:hypothetical protein [Sticta canariensis]
MSSIFTGEVSGCDVEIKRPVLPESCRQSSPAEEVVPTAPQAVPEVVPVAPGSGPSFEWNWKILPDLSGAIAPELVEEPAPLAGSRACKQRRFAEQAEDTLSGILAEGTPEEDIIGRDEIDGIMVAEAGGESEPQGTASRDCSSWL